MSYKWNNFCRITCSENTNFILYEKASHDPLGGSPPLRWRQRLCAVLPFLASRKLLCGKHCYLPCQCSNRRQCRLFSPYLSHISSSDASAVLTNIAGAAANSTVEAKIDEKLQKVGIKPGSFTMTFNNTDNTFTLNIFGLSLPGSYKIGEGEKTVTLTFGKTMQYFCMTGTLESTSTGATMLFTADKYLGFAKKVLKNAGEKSTELSSITSLVDNYDQLKIGFKLTK